MRSEDKNKISNWAIFWTIPHSFFLLLLVLPLEKLISLLSMWHVSKWKNPPSVYLNSCFFWDCGLKWYLTLEEGLRLLKSHHDCHPCYQPVLGKEESLPTLNLSVLRPWHTSPEWWLLVVSQPVWSHWPFVCWGRDLRRQGVIQNGTFPMPDFNKS